MTPSTSTYARSLKIKGRYTWAILQLFLCASSSMAATEISYQVLGYGDSHALVILSGNLANQLTTNLSSDGLSVRISAPGAVFVPQGTSAQPALVSQIQQVKRGIFTDLVLNLATASTLTASPGSATTRLFIQSRNFGTAPQHNTPITNQQRLPPETSNKDTALHYVPLQIILGDNKLLSKACAAALVLPSGLGLKSATGLTHILRMTAYGLDILWAWMSGRPLEYLSQVQCHNEGKQEEIKQMEALIKDLTEELMRIRGVTGSVQLEPAK